MNKRREKLFRIAQKIQNRLYLEPDFALRNYARFSRVMNGHDPFKNLPSPLDPKEGGFTSFDTKLGRVRVL